MSEKELIKQIHFYSNQLGAISQLVFMHHSGDNLQVILDELKYFYSICAETNDLTK